MRLHASSVVRDSRVARVKEGGSDPCRGSLREAHDLEDRAHNLLIGFAVLPWGKSTPAYGFPIFQAFVIQLDK